jgi:hypothetical protein
MSCNNCNTTPCAPKPKPCDPCVVALSMAPMVRCDDPVGCSDGCEQTMPCDCLIYKGAILPTLDVIDGDNLCSVITKLNTLVRALQEGSDTLLQTYRFPCIVDTSPVYVSSLKKDGVAIISVQTTFATPAAFLTYLQAQPGGGGFAYNSVTKSYTLTSINKWEITLSCTLVS